MRKTRETGTEARYMFLPNYAKGKYNTGLEERIKNPFQEQNADEIMNLYNLPIEWRAEIEKLVNYPEITKQMYYEVLHGQKPGFYTSAYNPENSIFKYTKGKVLTKDQNFIETFMITLYDGPNRFTDETPRGAMAIQLIKNHPKIAPDKKSINPVEHQFYISEENEAEMEKMRKQDLIDDATEAKLNLQRRSTEYKNYQVASLCMTVENRPIVKGVATKEQVKIALNNYIGEGKDQMKHIERFLEITDLLKSPENKSRFEVMYLVSQGFATGVLGRRDGYVYWWKQSDNPSKYKWTSELQLINYLISEYLTYNPEEQIQNWYNDLVEECRAKGAWIEN